MSTTPDAIQTFAAAADAALTDIGTDLQAIAVLVSQLQSSTSLSAADQATLTQIQTQLTAVQTQADALVPTPPVASTIKKAHK